ncbi:ABC transporter ATP-binding protein [Citricoccus muralis]|uniref:ABC transporter ATP-binding protein n=1 Tax=Citricoccus muralis TaxID=169134 RepID=A0ABY8H2E4_9MICC|nr:ABC transporter ATP-binding protein [Citricoccus muralis]WFP15307.1 ABC transporter ATP-binding protein [Citricoccus muralis]
MLGQPTSADLRLPAPGTALLHLDDVHKSVHSRTGRVEILRGVSLTARAGCVTALLGPNGAGKTTTLNISQGLDRPSHGSVRLLGEDPWRAPSALRSRVGVMLQEGGLPPSATPARLLRHIAALYRHPADILALSERLGIDDFADRTIRRLSGGQKQRVALAAALTGRPAVVFLDEPSAGLDPISRKIVFDIIEELKQAGLALILTTHLLDDAQRLADEVILLKHGVVERAGSVAELTSNGEKNPVEFTIDRRLTPDDEATVPQGLTLTEVDSQVSAGSEPRVRVSGVQGTRDLVALAQWWHERGLMPEQLTMSDRSLEDVFWEVGP